jgi:hypothetical protein
MKGRDDGSDSDEYLMKKIKILRLKNMKEEYLVVKG